MLSLSCQHCGITGTYTASMMNYEFDSVYVICYNCGGTIKIQCETPIKPITIQDPGLAIGQLVVITNQEHPWYNEIGIIRAKKFKHYRIELHSQLVWFPENWIKSNEPNDID